jgi:hypothetical protein
MRNQKSLIEGENAKVKRSNSDLQLGTAYHSSAPAFTPGFCGDHVAHGFLCSPIMCLYVLSSVLWCPLHFRIKTIFGSSLLPVVCRRTHALFTLFMFVCV